MGIMFLVVLPVKAMSLWIMVTSPPLEGAHSMCGGLRHASIVILYIIL